MSLTYNIYIDQSIFESKKNKMNCKECQSAQYEKNDQGQTVCAKCGLVTDQMEFQSAIAFNMQSGVYGGIVDRFDDNRINRSKNSFESRVDQTLHALKRDLQPDEDYEPAFKKARKLLLLAHSYKLSFEKKWQRLDIYVGAALYYGFRCISAPYLLIDISDKMKECSVTKLARCYLTLLDFVRSDLESAADRTEFSQGLQFIDPSIYIPRFVKSLEFKDNKHLIIETTKKLVYRMMLDWMSYGRRPSSLCGAALLISARFHGEVLTTAEVCKTVLVCDETIRKRLAEFNQTKLAQLTKEQFDQIKDIETDVPGGFMDPPCYTRQKQKEIQDEKVLSELTMKKAIRLEQFEPEQQEQKAPEEEVKPYLMKDDLSELDDKEVNDLILTKQEREQKTVLWNSMYGDWVKRKEEMNKNRNKKQQEGGESVIRKRKARVPVPLMDAPDPQTAVMKQFGNLVNPEALNYLFDSGVKKVKTENVKVEKVEYIKQENDFLNELNMFN